MTERSLFAELKRRNVIKASVAYLALGWVVTQITATVAPMLRLPEWVGPLVLWIGVIGVPFVVMFSWVYEITPEGIKRESEVERDASITHVTGRRLDYVIIGLLALAVVLFALDRFVVTPRREVARVAAVPAEPAATGAPTGKPATVTGIPDIESDPSIAVLPLVNMSSDKEQEYFSDGISEELLNLLAKVPKLRVIARTSSFGFKGTNTPIPEIARQLQVASVLEGSVRKSGDKVRITAQLIRASDGSHLWSETYDRKLDDIFQVQDEIAAAVVAQLKVKLLGAVPTAKPVDPKAYPLILQADALLDQGTPDGRKQAVETFKRALAIAPDEPRAWAGLSRVYLNQVIFGELAAKDGIGLGKEAAGKALARDPENPIALANLSRITSDFEFDLQGGARLLERALRHEPGNLVALNSAALLLQLLGRADESVMVLQYRARHDPTNPIVHNNLATVAYTARLWDEAIEVARTTLRLSPTMVGVYQTIGSALLVGKHDAAGALREFERETWGPPRLSGIAMAQHALGQAREADAALRELVAEHGSEQPAFVAVVHAMRGQPDPAFEWLDKAVAMTDPQLATVHVDPMFDALHDDARWLPFLRKLGYAPEQLAKVEFRVTLPE